jgi:hypothetical protein
MLRPVAQADDVDDTVDPLHASAGQRHQSLMFSATSSVGTRLNA